MLIVVNLQARNHDMESLPATLSYWASGHNEGTRAFAQTKNFGQGPGEDPELFQASHGKRGVGVGLEPHRLNEV